MAEWAHGVPVGGTWGSPLSRWRAREAAREPIVDPWGSWGARGGPRGVQGEAVGAAGSVLGPAAEHPREPLLTGSQRVRVNWGSPLGTWRAQDAAWEPIVDPWGSWGARGWPRGVQGEAVGATGSVLGPAAEHPREPLLTGSQRVRGNWGSPLGTWRAQEAAWEPIVDPWGSWSNLE